VRTPQTKGITRHFDPGIVALALVSAVVLAATIVLIATTALQIAWSNIAAFSGWQQRWLPHAQEPETPSRFRHFGVGRYADT
jgi:hypothetical protein